MQKIGTLAGSLPVLRATRMAVAAFVVFRQDDGCAPPRHSRCRSDTRPLRPPKRLSQPVNETVGGY